MIGPPSGVTCRLPAASIGQLESEAAQRSRPQAINMYTTAPTTTGVRETVPDTRLPVGNMGAAFQRPITEPLLSGPHNDYCLPEGFSSQLAGLKGQMLLEQLAAELKTKAAVTKLPQEPVPAPAPTPAAGSFH